MDSNVIENENIYNILYYEYALSNINAWSKFIKSKDLGIMHFVDDEYEIIDEKKWLLSKLKYGF
jgi:hypothetical protein